MKILIVTIILALINRDNLRTVCAEDIEKQNESELNKSAERNDLEDKKSEENVEKIPLSLQFGRSVERQDKNVNDELLLESQQGNQLKDENTVGQPIKWQLDKKSTDENTENGPPIKWQLGKKSTDENVENGPPIKWQLGKKSTDENVENGPPIKWQLGKKSTDENVENGPPIKWKLNKKSVDENVENGSPVKKTTDEDGQVIKWQLDNLSVDDKIENAPPIRWQPDTNSKDENADNPPIKWRLGKKSMGDTTENGPPMKWLPKKRLLQENWDQDKKKRNYEHLPQRPPIKWRFEEKKEKQEQDATYNKNNMKNSKDILSYPEGNAWPSQRVILKNNKQHKLKILDNQDTSNPERNINSSMESIVGKAKKETLYEESRMLDEPRNRWLKVLYPQRKFIPRSAH